MVAVAGGNRIPLAGYATFGTEALSQQVVAALQGYRACLMANHGLVATGRDLESALQLAVEVETLAHQYTEVLKIGDPVLLNDEQMMAVQQQFQAYGQG
jgi:L-fuculose-phosphate aldolase